MELSSPRFKALAVTAGFSLWFFIITSTIGIYTIESLLIFISSLIILTQIFALKLSKILDIFAIFNTKIFLGMVFVFMLSIYGIFFKFLQIDPLRLKKQKDTYWLDIEQLKNERIYKQY